MVFLEAGFDAVSLFDFGEFEVQIVEKSRIQDEEERGTYTSIYVPYR